MGRQGWWVVGCLAAAVVVAGCGRAGLDQAQTAGLGQGEGWIAVGASSLDHWRRASATVEKGKGRAAREHLDRALKDSPTWAEPWLVAAQVYEAEGNWGEAASAYRRFLAGPRAVVVWRQALGEGARAAALDGERLFVPTENGLSALRIDDGSLLWRFDSTYGVGWGPPAVSGGLIYVGPDDDGVCRALDPGTGMQRWSYVSDGVGAPGACPVVVGDTVAFGCVEGRLWALDRRKGEVRWVEESGGRASVSGFGREFLVVRGEGVKALTEAGGESAGSFGTPGPAWRAALGVQEEGGPRLAFVTGGGALQAVDWDKLTAKERSRGAGRTEQDAEQEGRLWSCRLAENLDADLSYSHGRVLVGTDDGELCSVNVATGQVAWRFRAGDWVRCKPVVAGGVVYCGSWDGGLHALREWDGALLWSAKLDGPIVGAVADRERLYVTTLTGGVWAFRLVEQGAATQPDARLRLAHCLARANDRSRAATELERVLGESPGYHAASYSDLADLLDGLGDVGGAAHWAGEGLRYAGEDQATVVRLEERLGRLPGVSWTFPALGRRPYLAVGHGVYVALGGGNAVCGLDAASGQVAWKQEMTYAGRVACGGDGQAICVATETGSLVRLGASDGGPLWTEATEPVANMVIGPSAAYVSGGGQAIAAHRLRDGFRIWQFGLPEGRGVRHGPCLAGSHLFFACDDGTVVCLDVTAPRLAWQDNPQAGALSGLSVSATAVYAGGRGGQLCALDPGTGKVRWRRQVWPARELARPPLEAGRTLCVVIGQHLLGLDVASGADRWRARLGFPIAGDLSTDGSGVYVGLAGGWVCAVDAASGALRWQVPLGEEIAQGPLVRDGRLFATTDLGMVYALDLAQAGGLGAPAKAKWEKVALAPEALTAWPAAGQTVEMDEVMVERAEELLGRGQRQQAVGLLRETVRLYPDYGPSYYLLGDALASTGDLAGARAIFEKAPALADRDPVVKLGFVLEKQGDLVGAAKAFRGRANFALARLLARRGDIKEAIVYYRGLGSSGDPAVYVGLGRALLQRRDRDGAARAFVAAAARGEPEDRAAKRLTEMLKAGGKPGGAVSVVRRFAPPTLTDADILSALADYLHFRHGLMARESAVRVLHEAVASDPNHFRSRFLLGTALRRQGQHEQAVKHLAAADRLKPKRATVLGGLGAAYLGLRDHRAAVRWLGGAVALNPRYVQAYAWLGDAFQALGQGRQAEDSYRKALALEKSHFGALWGLADLLMSQERLEEALKCYDRAGKTGEGSGDAGFLVEWGKALEAKGAQDEALARYRQAAQADPRHVEALLLLGRALAKKGDLAGAREQCESVLELAPSGPEAREARDLLQHLGTTAVPQVPTPRPGGGGR